MHCSMSVRYEEEVLLKSSPTAQRSPVAGRAVPARNVLLAELGFGLETRAHWVPFHFSTKLRPKVSPTAQTLVGEIAVTPKRKVVPAFGFVPGASFHDEPFQCSIRGSYT